MSLKKRGATLLQLGAGLLLLLLTVLLLVPKSTPAYASGHCSVDYVIVNQWGDGFQAQVTVVNNTSSAVAGWDLTWSFAASEQFSYGWGASFEANEPAMSASNPAGHWNGTIGGNGGTVSFGFVGTHSGTVATPDDFALNGESCTDDGDPTSTVAPPTATATATASTAPATSTPTGQPATATPTPAPPTSTPTATSAPPTSTPTAVPPTSTPTDGTCTVDYAVSQWNTGFTADITIINLTSSPIQGYTLKWDFTAGQQVTGSWRVEQITQSGSTVSASNSAGHWNGVIGANGGSVTFGFQATHNGDNPTPTSFLLNGEACNDDNPPPTATPSQPTATPVTPTATPTATPTSGPTPYPYQDPSLPIPERVSDLLSRMTLAEKIGQMTQVDRSAVTNVQDISTYGLGSILSGGGSAPSPNTPESWANMVDNFQQAAMNSRLEIPLIYGIDAVHGHNNVVGATIFPHNIGLGASRNPALVQQVGEITAEEVYATGIHWTFSPCLCVARDERWGRTYESFGEDPEIATMMTTIIDGYQGNDLSAPDTILATAKHWVGDGGTSGGEDQGNTQISEAELRAIHIPPYEAAVQRNVGAIMPSFSSWNGTKLHASDYLINDVLKGEIGFDGFVISDWGAIDQIPGDYNSDVRTAVNAGVDMVMVPYDYELFINTLTTEVQAGNVTMTRIDDAVSRILRRKFELGLFEQPFSDRSNINDIGSPAHRDVARQAVRESLVLLKNENNFLPLSPDNNDILVAGAHANDIGLQSGGWTISWQGSSGDITPGSTILEGVQGNVASSTNVTYIQSPQSDQLSGYDAAIVAVGEQPYAEGEGDDAGLQLSTADSQLVDRVCGAMPCVVVLVSGRPMIVETELNQADAFVAAWLPGTEGDGIAQVLFGYDNFSGQLPVSWPRSVNQLPLNVGDTNYDPLFPYGFGLTYP